MGLSRLAEQCRKCPFKDNCKNKRMEALGYLPEPIVAEAGASSAVVFSSRSSVWRLIMDRDNKNTFSYKLGQAVGLIAVLCVAAILIALTVKLIMWIL